MMSKRKEEKAKFLIKNSMKKNNRKMTSKAANKPMKRNAYKASFTTYNEKKCWSKSCAHNF